MHLTKMSLALAIGLGLGGGLVFSNPAVPAAAKGKGYKTYHSFPKKIRGTWKAKSHTDFYAGKNNSNWSYKFNKKSYSIIIRVKGKKAKVIHFPKKEINEVCYIYKIKKYHIQPKVTKRTYAYAGIIDLKPVIHHGKKALAIVSLSDGSYTYYYKVRK